MWLFSRKGPSGFSAASTAEQVSQGIDGSGLTAIVTGASSGIGAETARILALRGVHVVMAVRNISAGREVQEAIRKEIPNAKVDAMELDLSSSSSIKNFALKFNHSNLPLNLLMYDNGSAAMYGYGLLSKEDEFPVKIPDVETANSPIAFTSNNAGVMATPFMLSKDNIELQFATNHIGHFLLTNLLLETMKKTVRENGREGRIVNVSSRRHKFSYPEGVRFDRINDKSGYNSLLAYGQSKLANVLHANELSRRLKEDGIEITANSLHPGAIATNLFRHFSLVTGIIDVLGKHFLKTVQQDVTTLHTRVLNKLKKNSGADPPILFKGAATTCYVALHPHVKGVTGTYFSDSNIAEPSLQAKDTELAKRLWDFSSTLIHQSDP